MKPLRVAHLVSLVVLVVLWVLLENEDQILRAADCPGNDCCGGCWPAANVVTLWPELALVGSVAGLFAVAGLFVVGIRIKKKERAK